MSAQQSVECLAGETDVLGRKTCPSASLSTTNPTWPDRGSNPGRSGRKQATNRLSYVTAEAMHWSTCEGLAATSEHYAMLHSAVGLAER
jgi:hypothetical protein